MLPYRVDDLRRTAGCPVVVRLDDGATFRGRLRTEILSERSVSVYIAMPCGGGATLYIDRIAEIMPDDADTP